MTQFNSLLFSIEKLSQISAGVSSEEIETVNTFFKEITNNDAISQAYTALAFKMAGQLQIPVMSILEMFKTVSGTLGINETIAFWLNQLSSTRTVLVGVSDPLKTPLPVQRNIIQ